MPYRKEEVDDFECILLCCMYNNSGCCNVDDNVDVLTADKTTCCYYTFVKNAVFIIKSENEVDYLLDIYKEQGI